MWIGMLGGLGSLAGSSSHTFYQQNIHAYMKLKGCVQKALLALAVLTNWAVYPLNSFL